MNRPDQDFHPLLEPYNEHGIMLESDQVGDSKEVNDGDANSGAAAA